MIPDNRVYQMMLEIMLM